MHIWLFGYGSLIWRPEIDFIDRRPACLHGWVRRFWQGSHDHRGLPDNPGRVVTLVAEDGHCDGMAYLVDKEFAEATFDALDYREKNGYERIEAEIQFTNRDTAKSLVYIAPLGNHAFLGPAPLDDMVQQIRSCQGPSGRNDDYLFDLADAIRALDAEDDHVFELESAVRAAPAGEA